MTMGNCVRSSGGSFPPTGSAALDGVVTLNSMIKGLNRSMISFCTWNLDSMGGIYTLEKHCLITLSCSFCNKQEKIIV